MNTRKASQTDPAARRFLQVMSVVAIFIVLISLAVNYFTDRYYVFHPQDGVFEEILEPNTRVLKAAYLDENCEHFDAMIFGSSRAANYPTSEFNRVFGTRTYNFGVATGSLPGILARLEWLAGRGCMPGRVFLAVSIDRLRFPDRPNDLLRKEYPAIAGGAAYQREFLLSYLGSDALVSNIRKLWEKAVEDPAPRFRYNMASGDVEYLWDRDLEFPACPDDSIVTDDVTTRQFVDYLIKIKALTDLHESELSLIWNPVPRADQLAHLHAARDLLQAIDGVTNELYRLPVTDERLVDGRSFHDRGHFKPELGAAVIASDENRISLDQLVRELEQAAQSCL